MRQSSNSQRSRPETTARPDSNLAEQIGRKIACGILRGDYPPGARLPSMRELAVQFGVPLTTIQRVTLWLVAHGLITARQGSGLQVQDPRWADASLLPIWLEALRDRPAEAASRLNDYLALRRKLTADVIAGAYERMTPALLEKLGGHVAEFVVLSEDRHVTPSELWQPDFAFARLLLEIRDQHAYFAFYKLLHSTVEQSPLLAEVLYKNPRKAAQALQLLMHLLTSDKAIFQAGIGQIENALADVDAAIVKRFKSRLERAA